MESWTVRKLKGCEDHVIDENLERWHNEDPQYPTYSGYGGSKTSVAF